MFCRYCVLLITGEDQAFLTGNKAFLDFASVNKKDVLRFAYVYQRQQQPLCQALLHNQAALSPQVSGTNAYKVHTHASFTCWSRMQRCKKSPHNQMHDTKEENVSFSSLRTTRACCKTFYIQRIQNWICVRLPICSP